MNGLTDQIRPIAFIPSKGIANPQDESRTLQPPGKGQPYSMLPSLWKMIFKTAQVLEIRVFATTHRRIAFDIVKIAKRVHN